MIKRHSLAAASVAAGMLAIGVAAPAAADTTGNTPITVTIAGGSLSISVPTAVNLGSLTDTVAGSTLNGVLGQVQVLDARSAVAGSGWVVSAIATALTPGSGTAIAASRIGESAGAIEKVGTATYTANDRTDLTGVIPVVTATGITGNNSATWSPTIHVAVPGGAVAGDYTGSITHSVT